LVVKRKGENGESKLESAEQLRLKELNQKIEAARKVSNKIDKAKELRQKSQQQRERSIKDKLERVSIGSQKSQGFIEKTSQKAKTHIEKVQKVAAEQK
jgi:dsRNA-specific ribonuclease